MGQNLVDDDLEEERRREGENLHEQRRGQHMAERPATSSAWPILRATSSTGSSPAAWLIGSTSRQSPAVLRPANTMSAPFVIRMIAGAGRIARRSAVTSPISRALSPMI